MTSSFGEYRYNHLHGGIDIKTWGQIGYKALAIDSGSVVRVEVSPYGYGRAVYFHTQDDLIALYAHLSRFAPVLEAKVKAEQRRLGRFAVGLAFPPGQMVFKKGETVAYTGSTGATIPHLHFELRDLQNRLINPLVLGYKVPDRLTPTLVCVSISPLGYGSHVDGDFQPKRVFLIRTGRGKYRLKQTVSCWGDVGIGLSSYDLAEGCPNRLGLYRVKLFVDDVHVFTVENERFFLERIRDIGVGMECRLMRRGLGIFQKLYKEYENALSFYTPDLPGAGMLCSEDEDGAVLKLSAVILKKGMHTLRIEASD
ncbi:MAG TPA: M23 family metallopeptidase, partial [bacterium]